MPADFDFAIVGGGVVGLSAAAMLDQQGYRIAVIDPRHDRPTLDQDYDLRTYALTPASLRALTRVNVIAAVDSSRLAPFVGMQVWDAASSGELTVDARRIGCASLGTIIEHSNLLRALNASLDLRANVQRKGAAVVQCEQFEEHVALTLDNGDRLTAALIIVCDGGDSQVRTMLKIPARIEDFAQSAMVCNVETTLAHNSVARQRFLPDGPLAFLPLPPENQCAVVWSTDSESASTMLRLDETEFAQRLADGFEHKLGAVLHTSERKLFPLRSLHVEHYAHGRAVLLGDAAHVVHPLAGQGLNLGLMDAAAFADAFDGTDALSLRFPRAAVRRFERARRTENALMIHATRGLNRLFQRRSSASSRIRGMGMSAVDQFEPLKRWIVLRAMGEVGDVPTLAQR